MNTIGTMCRIFVLVFLFFSLFEKRIHHTKRMEKIAFILFAGSLAIIAYTITIPDSGGDLARHFVWLDEIRTSDISLLDFLFSNEDNVGEYGLKSMLAFNVLRFIVSKVNDNYILPAVSVFIDYLIVGYIIIDWKQNTNFENGSLFLVLLFCFVCMPYIMAVSGIRNALAASIAGLSIYLYLFRNKSFFLYCILMVIAITIHPAVLITVPVVLISQFRCGIFSFFVIFIAPYFIERIAKIMYVSNIQLFQIIGRKYLSNISENQYRGGRFSLYSILIMLSVFLFFFFIQYNKINKKHEYSAERKIFNFMGLYSLYIFGNIGNYDMVLRPSYVLGTLSPIYISILLNSGKKIKISKLNEVENIGTYICEVFCLYANFKFLIGYMNWFLIR